MSGWSLDQSIEQTKYINKSILEFQAKSLPLGRFAKVRLLSPWERLAHIFTWLYSLFPSMHCI